MCFLFLFSFGVVRRVVPSKEFFEEYDEKQRQMYAKAEHDFDALLENGKHCPDWRSECFEVVKDKAAQHGFLVETPMDYHSPDELALSSKVFSDGSGMLWFREGDRYPWIPFFVRSRSLQRQIIESIKVLRGLSE